MWGIKIIHAESGLKLIAFAVGRIASHEHAISSEGFVIVDDEVFVIGSHDRFLAVQAS